MTTSKDKTAKISPIIAGTPITTTTTTKDPKTTKASTAATTQKSQGQTSPQQNKTTDDAWKKRVGAAHKMWSKLSESELKKSAGEPAKLSELVQARYSISGPEADKQVKKFIDNRS